MDASTVFAIGAAFLTAGLVKGWTGIGFSTVCLALLARTADPKAAIALVLLPSLASNALVMVPLGSPRRVVVRFWPLYLATPPGLAVGLAALGALPSQQIGRLLGGVLVAYALLSLLAPAGPIGALARYERRLQVPVGLVTGIVNGLTGSQVMPSLPYLMALQLDRRTFVQAINVSFTWSSLWMAAGLVALGLLDVETLSAGFAGLAPAALGIFLGGRIRDRFGDGPFRRAVLVAVAALGASLLVR